MSVRRVIRILWILAQSVSIVLMGAEAVRGSDLRRPSLSGFVLWVIAAAFVLAAVLGCVSEFGHKRLARRINVGIPVALMAISIFYVAHSLIFSELVGLVLFLPACVAFALASAGIHLMYEATAVGTPEERQTVLPPGDAPGLNGTNSQ